MMICSLDGDLILNVIIENFVMVFKRNKKNNMIKNTEKTTGKLTTEKRIMKCWKKNCGHNWEEWVRKIRKTRIGKEVRRTGSPTVSAPMTV